MLKTEIVKLLFQTEDVRLLKEVNAYFKELLKKGKAKGKLFFDRY